MAGVLDWLLQEADAKVTVWKEGPTTEETEEHGEEGREPREGTLRDRCVLSLLALARATPACWTRGCP